MAVGKSAGSIFIDLLLNDAKFVSATTKTQNTIKKLSTTAVSAAKTASIAFTAAGAVITAISINNIRNIDKTIKSARDLNLTVRDFQAIELVSKETGRSFKEINDNISLFSDRIKDAREFNDRFNLSISELDASKIREANIVLARVSQTFNSLGTQLAIKFAPIVSHIGNLFLESGSLSEKFFTIIDKGVYLSASALDILRRSINGVNLVFNAFILSVGDLVAKTSLALYDLGVEISNLLNKIPGISLEAEDALLGIGLAAKRMSDDAKVGFNNALEDAENFEKTTDKIARIQEEANKRLGNQNPNNISLENISRATKSIEKWLIKQREALETLRQEADYIGKTKIEIDLLKDAREFEAQVAERSYGLKGRELQRFREQAEAIKKLRQEVIQYNYESSRTAQAGFEEFSAKYQEDATNMAKNVQSVLENAFKGAEDAFVEFTKTGKLNFRDLANSIIEDLIRIQFKQSVSGLLGGLGGGSGGLGGLFGNIFGSQGGISRLLKTGDASFIGPLPAFADGGYLGPGQFGIAGEAGAELIYGGKTGVSVFNQDQIGNKGNVYQIDARGADQGAVMRLEQALLALAGPGVIERRVNSAQARGEL